MLLPYERSHRVASVQEGVESVQRHSMLAEVMGQLRDKQPTKERRLTATTIVYQF